MRPLSLLLTLVCLVALAGCAGPGSSVPGTDRPPVPETKPPAPAVNPLSTAPVLRLSTGMHTAAIKRMGVDAAQRLLVTGSDDKTVRVWDLASGRLLRTLRPPLGPGNEGKIYAVALSPDGQTVAASGFTDPDGPNQSIYLFDLASGRLRQRLSGLPSSVNHLIFTPDGTFLAATLSGRHGLRVYRSQDGTEVARDTDYGADSYWVDIDTSGRLVTTSYDGFVRLYERGFRLRMKRQAPGGQQPFGVAFAPDGSRVAVGFSDSTRVALLAGQDLNLLPAPDTTGVDNGNLGRVAWSADGQWLYAAGRYRRDTTFPIRRWAAGGRGTATDLPAAQNTIFHLLPLAGGGVAFGASDPAWGVLDAAGQRQRFQGAVTADMRDFLAGFRVTPDGSRVQFAYELAGKTSAHFVVHERLLTLAPAPDTTLVAPLTTAAGLDVQDWLNNTAPRLNGTALKLDLYETARSLAIAPDGQRFLLGTAFALRLFDRRGVQQWQVAIPGEAWSVNITRNGQLAVAAFADGTIRWYRLGDGYELLAFFPHNDRKRWVLWTPMGYYDAAPGAEGLIGWHVNRTRDQEADFFPVGKFRSLYYRPDVVAQVLETRDETEAVRLANAAAQRRQEAVSLQQRLPPVVQILTPQESTTVSSTQVTVRFSVRSPSGEPVTSIRGLVDGRPVAQARGVQEISATGEVTRELQIPLPMQDSEVSIIAENRYAASVPSTIRVRWQGAAPPTEAFSAKPKLYVLAVGISRYQQPGLALDYAAKDAQDLSEALRRQQGQLYRAVEVRLLTDAQASREAILDGLEWLQRQTTSKDVAAIFMAGHGVNDPNGYYYYLPANVDPERLKSSGVAFSEITNTVKALAGKVLFFLDTCHAGNVTREKRRAVRDIAGVVNELSSAENGAIVFAASTGNQFSQESPDWGNGAFTKALVEGLRGQADYRRSGRITVNMLDLYLSERVKELTKGTQTPTTTKPPNIADFPVALVP